MTKLDRPQRVVIPFRPPGSLLKRAESFVKRLREVTGIRDEAYLAMVRECPCLRCGLDPAGVAAHVRMSSAAHNKFSTRGGKPADKWAVPLCAGCHTDDKDAQHKVGERIFWARVGLNPLLVAERLYAKRGDVVAMSAVAYTEIAERESREQIGADGV